MKTPLEIRNHLLKKAIEVFPVKHEHQFKTVVFDNDIFKRGVKVYNCWKDAIIQTELIIYKNLTK